MIRIGSKKGDKQMTKTEFLEALRRALNGNMAAASVEDNLKFYDTYFITETAKGRTESDILSGLGDPRILARTLIDAAERAGDEYAHEANETQFRAAGGPGSQNDYQEEKFTQRTGGTVNRVHMPGWLIAILVLMAVVVVISVVGSLMWAVLPYLPIVLVVYIIRLFRKK